MGFFYASGEGIRRGTLPMTISPVDLVPTILYLTGNPVSNDMDGRVIFFMLEENRYFKNPLIYE
jgi:hypothetical protein